MKNYQVDDARRPMLLQVLASSNSEADSGGSDCHVAAQRPKAVEWGDLNETRSDRRSVCEILEAVVGAMTGTLTQELLSLPTIVTDGRYCVLPFRAPET